MFFSPFQFIAGKANARIIGNDHYVLIRFERFSDPRSYANGDLHLAERGFLASSPRHSQHRIGLADIPRDWQVFVRLLVVQENRKATLDRHQITMIATEVPLTYLSRRSGTNATSLG